MRDVTGFSEEYTPQRTFQRKILHFQSSPPFPSHSFHIPPNFYKKVSANPQPTCSVKKYGLNMLGSVSSTPTHPTPPRLSIWHPNITQKYIWKKTPPKYKVKKKEMQEENFISDRELMFAASGKIFSHGRRPSEGVYQADHGTVE